VDHRSLIAYCLLAVVLVIMVVLVARGRFNAEPRRYARRLRKERALHAQQDADDAARERL